MPTGMGYLTEATNSQKQDSWWASMWNSLLSSCSLKSKVVRTEADVDALSVCNMDIQKEAKKYDYNVAILVKRFA